MKKNQTREKIDEIKEIILDYLSYRHVMNSMELMPYEAVVYSMPAS